MHHLETELVTTEEQLQNEKKKEKQSQLKKKKKNLQKISTQNPSGLSTKETKI